ncbi:uncharacterized protein LOC106883005 [Octopus bimaculoides]|uniref:uncharacterized protein LOC106883005 n=1 Tax=Octopus bimaculoides TaxID=37653 RepID=UPI00071D7FDD|nr:uncharacterized protein LOC106883005 [Octopus bimaculoides]|eukprot:XP_014789350.1 PREDICTED: uncharacterized protein LOC106883005 [Octopus bimaculoides]
MDLHQVFIDSINRVAFWKILQKLGCPEKFVRILRQLHDKMEVRVNIGGTLSDPISVENSVKQGDIPAPTLFALYLTIIFQIVFDDCTEGVYIKYRTAGNLYKLKRLCAKTKVLHSSTIEFLYADDCDLLAHSQEDMQHMMNMISAACTALSLSMNLKKTVLTYQPASKLYVEPSITVKEWSKVRSCN